MTPTQIPRYSLRFHPFRITVWIAFLMGVLAPYIAHRMGERRIAYRLLWPGRSLVAAFRLPTENLQVIYMVNFLLILLVAYIFVFFVARSPRTD